MATLSKDELLRYWLLTSAIDHPVELACFFPKFEWGPLNMRDLPGCTANDYVRELLELFDRQWIEFSSLIEEYDLKTRFGVIQMLDLFNDFSEQNPDALLYRRGSRSHPDPRSVHRPDLIVDFQLTEAGGNAWEKIAKPNWKKFLEEYTNLEGEGEELRPSSAELASQDLNLVIAHLGWFRDEWTESIVYGPQFESIKLQFHEEYQALYWKRLSSVYKATFALMPVSHLWPKGPNGEPHWYQEPKWFKDWRNTSREWFTEPWNLPDWPA